MNGANMEIHPKMLILLSPVGVTVINVLNNEGLVPKIYATKAVIPNAANIHKNTLETNVLGNAFGIFCSKLKLFSN